MQTLDRLGWAAGIGFVCYGVRFGVRVTDAEVLDALPDYLPPGRRPARSPVVDYLYSLRVGRGEARRGVRHFHLVYAGSARFARTMELREALEQLESRLHLHVAVAAQRHLFVHAGVVGWRGQAIVLPGRSYSGKSTLVAALVRAGASYYSDEYAVFDPKGRVHAYAKRLSLRQDDGASPLRCHPEALGGSVGREPLPVGLVAVCQYQPEAEWRPRPLSPGRSALALLANTVLARERPESALAVFKRVVAKARVLKGVRGEAEHTVREILDAVERREHAGLRGGYPSPKCLKEQ